MRREVRFWIDGEEYKAPEMWLAGAMASRERAGMSVNEAAVSAMNFWAVQTKMAAEWEAQHQ